MKPIRPEDIAQAKTEYLPEAVIDVFNELIALNFEPRSQSAHIEQDDIVKMICGRLGCERREAFDRNYLDVEPIYEKAGWKVKYEKPGYNESGTAFFSFRPARKEGRDAK